MDIATLVEQVIAEIDLTALVTQRVDLRAVVDDVLDQLDLTQLVMDRVDLAAVAERVIDDIDLPEIIRESTGSIAYETVRGIRLQSVDADRAVERVVDRILLRRRGRRTQAPQDPDLDTGGPDASDPGAQHPTAERRRKVEVPAAARGLPGPPRRHRHPLPGGGDRPRRRDRGAAGAVGRLGRHPVPARPAELRWPAPPIAFVFAEGYVIAVVYLTVTWRPRAARTAANCSAYGS